MSEIRRWALVALLCAAATAGCTEVPQVRAGAPSMTARPEPIASADASSPALAAQKKKAGIANCPVTAAPDHLVTRGLPDLILPCLGGGPSVVLAGLRGTPTVINVWAQWCPPCRAEAPHFSALAKEEGDRVRLLGIDSVDPNPDQALAFAQQAGWTYPQLFDEDGATLRALRLPPAPPQTLFVTAEGTLAYVHAGPFRSTDELRRAVAEHLGVER